MGSLYVSQYAAHGCPDISASAYRILMRMAVVVLDQDSEPGAGDEGMYFGGGRALPPVLGYGVTDENDAIPNAAKQTIARAIRDLKEHGYIADPKRHDQRGHWNRAYRLNLTDWPMTWQTRGQSV